MLGKKIEALYTLAVRLGKGEETAYVILLYVTCRADELIDQ